MTADPAIAAAKQAMREEMMERRDALTAAVRQAAAKEIAGIGLDFATPQPGAFVSGYCAMRSELDPLPLMERLAAAGHPLALPVTPPKGNPLVFRCWKPGAELVEGGFGVCVPDKEAAEVEPDVLLVPLLAFDPEGYRLGYGAGFYDRTLAGLRARKSVTAIGIAYDEQEVENVPHDDYDQRLDWVLMPSGPLRIERK